jgi:hypothetical protein
MSLPHNTGWRFGGTNEEEYVAKLVDEHERVLLTIHIPTESMGMWIYEMLKFIELNFEPAKVAS